MGLSVLSMHNFYKIKSYNAYENKYKIKDTRILAYIYLNLANLIKALKTLFSGLNKLNIHLVLLDTFKIKIRKHFHNYLHSNKLNLLYLSLFSFSHPDFILSALELNQIYLSARGLYRRLGISPTLKDLFNFQLKNSTL